MDTREWTNLQEAMVWVFWPIVQLFLALFLGSAFMTAIMMVFSRAVRWMTSSRIDTGRS